MKTNLKKAVPLFIGFGIFFLTSANATIHRVYVNNYSFSPSSFNASVNDTVKFVWQGGDHTTTSTSVPAGAATWGSLSGGVYIDNNSPSDTAFEYKITTSGTYNYRCNFHYTMNPPMIGSFTVVATGIPVLTSSSMEIARIYPNPATNVVNIHLSVNPVGNQLSITDILGKEVINQVLTNIDNAIDVSTWKKGVYFYHLKNNGELMEGKFEVQ